MESPDTKMAQGKREKEKCAEKQNLKKIKRLGWGVRHIQVACMCLCITALVMVRSSMGVAILAMTDHTRRNDNITIFDWDKKTQGVILSSFFWGYVAMQIPAGVLSNRFGGKLILLSALLSNGAICLVVPIFASLGGWQLVCAARVAIGLTQACTYPSTHTLLGRWLPDHERVKLSGVVFGGTQLGTILGMPVSGILAGTSVGWPLVFYAMAGLMLVTAGVWHWMTASCPAQHPQMTVEEQEYIEKGMNKAESQKHVRTPWRHILTSRAVWATVMAHIGCAYGFVMFFVDLPTYLEKGLKISLANSAALSALPYVGMWAGGVVSTAICENVYNRGLLSGVACRKIFNTIGSTGITLGLIGLCFVGPEDTTLAIVFLVGALTLSGFQTAGFIVNHLDLSPNFAGLLLSLTNFIANIGSITTPIVTSVILQNDSTDLSRWRIVFMITAAISVIANIAYLIFGTADLQPWDDPDFLEKRAADPEEMKPVMNEDKENEKAKEANASQ